jgi:catechol 2,3-dioxygenase
MRYSVRMTRAFGWGGFTKYADAPTDPAATRVGNNHLKVADLVRAIAHYSGNLDFEVMQQYGHGAAIMSAGEYHHHIGLNTWDIRCDAPPAPGRTGLCHLALLQSDRATLGIALKRSVDAGWPIDRAADQGMSEAVHLRDPDVIASNVTANAKKATDLTTRRDNGPSSTRSSICAF